MTKQKQPLSSNSNFNPVQLYLSMRDYIYESIEDGVEQLSSIPELISQAQEKMNELDELTQEEGVEVGKYLQRDLEAAGNYLTESKSDLKEWFHLNEERIEERVSYLFTAISDPTRIALTKLDAQARAAQTYHSGEVIDSGQLKCEKCGEILQFSEASLIPECPKCGTTLFVRIEK